MDQWTFVEVDNTRSDGKAFGLGVHDLNSDSYADVVTGKYCYLNPGDNWDSEPWVRVDLPVKDALFATDVDGDENGDIIALNDSGMYWLEATASDALQWSSVRVCDVGELDHGISTQGYASGQIVPGGPVEFVVSCDLGTMVLIVPDNPESQTWDYLIISDSRSEGVAVGDIDLDGDLDVATGNGTRPIWLQNPEVEGGSEWVRHELEKSGGSVDRIEIGDIDGDGRPDIAVTKEGGPAACEIHQQPSDLFSEIWPVHTIDNASGLGFLSMHLADFDDDGVLELVTGNSTDEAEIEIRDCDANMNCTSYEVDRTIDHQTHIGCLPVDLDNDGDLDLVSNSYKHKKMFFAWRNDATAVSARGKMAETASPAVLRSGVSIPTAFTVLGRSGKKRSSRSVQPIVRVDGADTRLQIGGLQ